LQRRLRLLTLRRGLLEWLRGLLELLARVATRLNRLIGTATNSSERIGLADQARELGEWIALAFWSLIAATVVVRGERSIRISISHCDVASPSGKPPTSPF
jgi:hypothetical protein